MSAAAATSAERLPLDGLTMEVVHSSRGRGQAALIPTRPLVR